MGNWISSLPSVLGSPPAWLLLISTCCTEPYMKDMFLSTALLKLLPPWDLHTVRLETELKQPNRCWAVSQRFFNSYQKLTCVKTDLGRILVWCWRNERPFPITSPLPHFVGGFWQNQTQPKHFPWCSRSSERVKMDDLPREAKLAAGVAFICSVNVIFYLCIWKKLVLGCRDCLPEGFCCLLDRKSVV